jgi:transcription initiation factor IIE alpha subunit
MMSLLTDIYFKETFNTVFGKSIKSMVRRTDPETSYDAAVDASKNVGNHRVIALQTLLEHGAMTDFELAEKTGLQQTSIGKRRKDCQDIGLVDYFIVDGEKQRRKTPSGSSAYVWQITELGKKFLETTK